MLPTLERVADFEPRLEPVERPEVELEQPIRMLDAKGRVVMTISLGELIGFGS